MTCDCKGSPPVEWLHEATRAGRQGLALDMIETALRTEKDPRRAIAKIADVTQETIGIGIAYAVPSLRDPQEPAS